MIKQNVTILWGTLKIYRWIVVNYQNTTLNVKKKISNRKPIYPVGDNINDNLFFYW